MVKIPERAKDWIAFIEAFGSIQTIGILLYFKPEVLVKIFNDTSLFYSYAALTGYLFLDGYFYLALRPHKFMTEMITNGTKRLIKKFREPYSKWFKDKTPMEEEEAREKYRFYHPFYRSLIV